MELQQERPPDYTQRSPESVEWPAIPQHAPDQPRPSSVITLPDLKTVLSSDFERVSPHPESAASPQNSVRSLPRIDPGYRTMQDHGRGMDTAMAASNETDSVMSYEDIAGRSASRALSVDDPDVRMAAEALSGLGNPSHFARGHENIHVPSHENQARASDGRSVPGNPEPLLELVSAAHPWVGGTMKGSLTAYETAKHYSPRIVRYGVNLAERNIGTPVVSAVGSVSQITGVEAGLRRYLDARRPNDIERGDKNMDSSMDVDEEGTRPRDNSIPPPYRASRPPSYREEASPASAYRSGEVTMQERPSQNRSWSSQLFVTTSGLSVALSSTSRKSLRLCLSFLGAQAGYLQHVSKALSLALNNYEQRRQEYRNNTDLEKGGRASTPDQDENARQLAEEIRQHCETIWKTLQHAVTTVSSYTGAALPQNAREFVRLQLMSLPQRWRIVANTAQAESETSRAAQRMIDFSSEGLDMMSQVAGVLKATLDSAESWLATVGRGDQQAEEQQDQPMQDAINTSQGESEKS